MHGVDVRTVRRWDEEGHPRNDDGTYGAAASIEWRLTRALEGDQDGARAKARADNERADKLALENAVRRGELVEVAEVEREVGALLADIRTRVLAVPTKSAPRVAHATDPAVCREIIERDLHDALGDIATADLQGNSADDAAGDGEPAAPADEAAAEAHDLGVG